ncbi:MAG: DUF1707 domain-containing protein [Arachnia propionica]|uniref:DUF1707 SHOCT-like domain-containing protein n=1 Tax=Arachnia propionica TaxID=1750 RepID=UPI002705D68D|nr:DUF1707 domain-containing protein [Arachnia propionica]
MDDGHIRVGDDERNEATARLQEFHVEGRLTFEELEERIQAALVARTGADLDRLFTDLPGGAAWRQPLPEPVLPVMRDRYGSPDSAGSPDSPNPVEFMQGSHHAARQHRGNAIWWISTVFVFAVMFGALRGRAFLLIPLFLVGMAIMSKWTSTSRARQQASTPQLSHQQRSQVMRELASGNTFQAIRLYRGFTGADLHTAKMTIDAWRRGLPG